MILFAVNHLYSHEVIFLLINLVFLKKCLIFEYAIMPNGILIMMRKSKISFANAAYLSNLIDEYFNYIKGAYHSSQNDIGQGGGPVNKSENKIWDREPEPPTISGLAFFLGFESMQAFIGYEEKGRFAHILKRARLRIESVYEKKLHLQSSAGAIFALKTLHWNEQQKDNTATNTTSNNIKIEIVETGPDLAGNEKDVVL